MKFTGRKLLFGIILLTMMIPFQVVMIPLWKNISRNFKYVLSLDSATRSEAYGIFMLTSFFSGIPKSLDEAAKIDGMGEWKIYLKIILPLAKPALVTLGIYHFMNNSNDLLYPMMPSKFGGNADAAVDLQFWLEVIRSNMVRHLLLR